jgi:hypothetical protein
MPSSSKKPVVLNHWLFSFSRSRPKKAVIDVPGLSQKLVYRLQPASSKTSRRTPSAIIRAIRGQKALDLVEQS